MTIFELASELGKALKNDEKLVRLADARKNYENDPDLQKMMVEYEVQQKALQGELTKDERDTMFIDVIQKRINELYEAIMSHPIFTELNEAQAEVNELMNAVNNTITFEITGELPSCTHDCSTCGGGCSH
ncbi:MAG: YlbF family regulator [Clostridia bacterium]|nr:YlbF family regulator [Clostridia bacterium]MBR2613455.1 YlbF family regulator [Clostridia bacterium]